MNLNHDVHSSPKEENYLNGSIDDFTDCIDFTKQYQKSCGYAENCLGVYGELNSNENDVSSKVEDKTTTEDYIIKEVEKNSVENNKNEFDSEPHPMEPDVSITVEESNLEKTINNVAQGTEAEEKTPQSSVVEISKKKGAKHKIIKKNHLKLPIGKNSKKNISLLKLKNGKYVKKKNESFQYQGIQSNIKFKCYKCSYSDFASISELQSHQRKCIAGTEHQPLTESVNSASNYRITRKVYLCSACGSYYENWNLFLHMKEIHNRHICLYCLGMFSQPDKLAQHLQAKHNVIEQNLSSSEEFLKLYRGTCYLVCVSCEAMFSEQEEFYEHSCASQADESNPCPLCGLQGAHFPTCRRAFSDRYVESECEKSHPALGIKLNTKKKKVKGTKKAKDVFRIVNNEHNGEMSVIVRKQNLSEGEPVCDFKSKDNYYLDKDEDKTSPLRNSNEDLKQYNEKLLQLYRPNKPPPQEKIISSIQSIEDSINRVVENSRISDEEIKENEEEDNQEDQCAEYEPEPEEDIQRESLPLPSDQPPISLQPNTENHNETLVENEDKDANATEAEAVSPQINSNENQIASDCESTDSEKLTIAFDAPPDNSADVDEKSDTNQIAQKSEDNIPTASVDTPYIYVSLKNECDNVKTLIRECVKISCWNCVYCSHSKRIAVNGKQLALHVLAEHRFVTVAEDSTDEEKSECSKNIIKKIKASLFSLENCYFNTDTFDSEDKEFWKASDRIYECFHCLFATYVHKELYIHNRKMHQKAVFLCIMCKSNFYNYSELLCHLCPGIYISGQVINPDITYRCFLCNVDPLPSSFRLMVHLRRRHNSCDICFDMSSNQFQLSTHVWKHKLSHMCYRCGIAYRNKPDITKHLFWKHGTESVLCKKCLQKKWPHVYHFCVPPNSFICDECSVSLKSAVALKVHKRLHTGDYPYPCEKCEEKFISRKLLAKHLAKHEEEENRPPEPNTPETESAKNSSPVEESRIDAEAEPENENENEADAEVNVSEDADKKPEKEKKSKKKKVLTDVFDLPPVNLSESDDSDQEETELKPKVFKPESPVEENALANGFLNGDIQKEESSPTQIVDGVWNNFQNYLVAKDMPKTFRPGSPFKNMTLNRIKEIMLSDHDYHIIPNSSTVAADGNEGTKEDPVKSEEPEPEGEKKKVGVDHDYCNNNGKQKGSHKAKQKTKHREDEKSSSSDSSSDSDSSCSCGSNCSCTSGSSSSSSSNDSDSDSREKKKQKKNARETKTPKEVEPEVPAEVDISVHDISNENVIRESDLETDETETDEDFYDYNPAREANRILAEKRTQLLANLNGSDAVVSSPSTTADKPQTPKKKTKLKKKRSQYRPNNASRSSKKKNTPVVNRVTPAQTENSAGSKTIYETPQPFNRIKTEEMVQSSGDADSKRPKRKRVPLKFYGFSSDDENETGSVPRKRDKSEHNTTTPAPAVSTPSYDPVDSTPTIWNPHSKNSLSWRVEKSESVTTPKVNPIKIRTSQAMRQTPTVENVVSSDMFQLKRPDRNFQINGNSATGQKSEKLYCFCQCPYDEVSEMIACDAEDCVIEWFHFECVGIMVPPKGSWYCPECRKKLAAENEFLAPSVNDQNIN